jgi:hypothetical protein
MLVALTIIGGLTATSFATEATSDTTVDVESQTDELSSLGMSEIMLGEEGCGGGPGFRHGHRGGGLGGMSNIEVSTGYTENVNAILEADTDVQALIAEGYSVTSIRPVITNVVEADGSVVTSASTAVVTLENESPGYAVAHVDVSQAEVTELVISSRTVIDKTSS